MTELLPITRAALTSDPRLAEAARRIAATHGVNYLDDATVAEMLERHEPRVRRTGVGWGVSGILVLIAAVSWLALGEAESRFAGAVLAAGLGIAALVVAVVSNRRRLRHPELEGYRQVLAAAKAYDVPVPYVPGWLTGQTAYS